MKVIILAAGVGSRLRPLTDNTPKSLLSVAGKKILERNIENLQALGINSVCIVTGYLEEVIQSFVQERFPTLSVEYIRNERYSETNTGYSLLLTKDYVAGDEFIKFDADVVFEKAILEKLLQSTNSALCIDTNINLEAEEVKVTTDESGNVLSVGKKLDPHTANGESIGIEKIAKDAGDKLFEILSDLMQHDEHLQDYYDDSYTTLVEAGFPFEAVDITGLKWVEIDNHQDYERANSIFA